MEVNIHMNLKEIVDDLQSNKSMKLTNIAKAMGYTTTTQLHHTLEGKSLLSTKAVIELIQNLNVNPLFLYTGKGEMFLSEKDEVDELKEEIREIEKSRDIYMKTNEKLKELISQLERRNADLIDITALAIKNFKHQENEGKVTEDNGNLIIPSKSEKQ